jgi:hypothetical protein
MIYVDNDDDDDDDDNTQFYSAFNRGGNRERSVQPEQHLSRIAGVTADSGMSQQR